MTEAAVMYESETSVESQALEVSVIDFFLDGREQVRIERMIPQPGESLD